MRTATFRRYVDDPATSERELRERSGQTVTLIGAPTETDPDEPIWMQRIRFADGYEAEAFLDELSPAPATPDERSQA